MRNILKINSFTYNSNSNLHVDIKKYVRVIKNKQLRQTIKNGNVDTSTNTIKWDQLISFQFDDEQSLLLSFEIFDQHQFGFDQKELLGVLKGQINFSISNINQNSTNYDVYNLKNQKVGTISLEIDLLILESQKSQEYNQQKNTLIVLSIISIFNDFKKLYKTYKNVNCYASLHLDNKRVMTSNNKKFAQKLFWSQKLKMQQISQGFIELRINYIDINGEENIICRGILNLQDLQKNNKLKSNRIQLFNNEEARVGYCLVQTKYGPKNLNPQYIVEIPKQKGVQASILFSNQNIIISKSNRFSPSPKRNNNRVGHINPYSSSNLSGQNRRSNSFGHSIKNIKHYKTIESNPGVGKYKLPSLFDRYS